MRQRPLYTEQDFAQAVRSARRQRGWTQSMLAAQANISKRVVEKVERGEGRTVNLSTIFALLRALSIDLQLATRRGSPISLDDEEEVER